MNLINLHLLLVADAQVPLYPTRVPTVIKKGSAVPGAEDSGVVGGPLLP